MPELPEVETIRRGLEKYIVGKSIKSVDIRLKKIFRGDPDLIIGLRVIGVRRYGKGLVIDLSNDYSIAVHVKMTGQFVYQGKETLNNFHPKLGLPEVLPSKHTHVIFRFKSKINDESLVLFYNDIRQFGWINVAKTSEVLSLPFFKSLGQEPFRDLSLWLFKKILSSSSMPIKPLLMDQNKISGVGNIYANDALYGSGIDPRRPGKSLGSRESSRLYKVLLEVLQRGIDYGGASEINYINVEGKKGSYQDHFLVYGRAGIPCTSCKTPIKRIVQSGRSTFFCPVCQA